MCAPQQRAGFTPPDRCLTQVAFGPYRLGCYDDMDLCKRVCDLLSIKETVDNRGDVDRLTLHFDISTCDS